MNGRSLVLATALLLAFAAPATARDAVVRSFDGTELHVTFPPAEGLKPGKRAPTIDGAAPCSAASSRATAAPAAVVPAPPKSAPSAFSSVSAM